MLINEKYNLNDFYNVGYLIIKMKERSLWNNKILPDKIISASECICDHYPHIFFEDKYWMNDSYKTMFEWTNSKFQQKVFHDTIFSNLQDAKEFVNLFLSEIPEIKIIGINLPKKYYELFLEDQNNDEYELVRLLKQKKSVNPTDKVLGYEILGFEWGGFHSYICNSLENDYLKMFNFKLNEHGFIDTLEESEILTDYTNENELGEPVLWLSWLITEYSHI